MRTTSILLLGLTLGAPLDAQRRPKIQDWKDVEGGRELKTKTALFQTTLGDEVLKQMAQRIADLQPAYEKHFGTRLKSGWRYVVFKNRKQYEDFAKKVTKGRLQVQGQCFRDQRVVAVLTAARYGWLSTLSHEYAHAYYDCNGAIWLREGIASLVEVAEFEGRGKRRKMLIPVNPPRLRGLRLHQGRGHYLSIEHLVKAEKEPDGYGYSYEHGWSLHYFLYKTDEKAYGAFLAAVRKKPKADMSADLKTFFKLDLDSLDAEWKKFIASLPKQ